MKRLFSLPAKSSYIGASGIIIWALALVIIIAYLVLTNICQIYLNTAGCSASLTALFGQYITILGMLTAVSVAIMSWIYNQGINSSQKGFGDLRTATSRLQINLVDMNQNFNRAATQHQPFLHVWADATASIILRLNEITPAWKGWKEAKDLEQKLSEYTHTQKSALLNTGNFMATDPVWLRIYTNSDTYDREVLIGLYWLSIGAMATATASLIYQYFLSIVVLLLASLLFSLAGVLWLSVTYGIYPLITILFNYMLISHVIWLACIITSWWQKQRKQQVTWESQ
jgi:hypothetical protein